MRAIQSYRDITSGECYVCIDGRRYATRWRTAMALLHLAEVRLSEARKMRADLRERATYLYSEKTQRAMRADLRAQSLRAIAYALKAQLALRAGLVC